MRKWLTDILLRLGSGLSLLVLIAAQQHALAWLETPPPGAQPPLPTEPTSEESDESREPPLALTSCLPDVVAPRRDATQRAPLLERLGQRDIGAGHDFQPNIPTHPPGALPALPTTTAVLAGPAAAHHQPLVRHAVTTAHAIGTVLCAHAPPRACHLV